MIEGMIGVKATVPSGHRRAVLLDADLDARTDQHSGDLLSLDIMSPSGGLHGSALQGLNVVVIGGGPAGLTFARIASANGARVTVLEKAGDPRVKDLGYTNRSFNISLDRVGRYVLGGQEAWQGGLRVIGRAVHNYQDTGQVKHTRYGTDPDYDLVNIPRPVLRQNMVNLALQAGAAVRFESQVTSLEPNKGEVTFTNDGTSQKLSADLVVVCDGLHSIADELIRAESGEDYYLKPELRRIVSAMIYAEDNPNLSLNHIHLWYEHSSDSFVVGIPNRNGSVALLMASPYADISRDTHPFATPELANERFKRDFPQLFTLSPQIAKQLPKQPVYHFKYKAHATFRVGRRGIIVGDAACVMPPWANYGANSAMASASSLAYHLIGRSGNTDAALDIFQSQQRILSRLLLNYANDHGKFFSGPVIQSPEERSDPALALLIKQACDEARKS